MTMLVLYAALSLVLLLVLVGASIRFHQYAETAYGQPLYSVQHCAGIVSAFVIAALIFFIDASSWPQSADYADTRRSILPLIDSIGVDQLLTIYASAAWLVIHVGLIFFDMARKTSVSLSIAPFTVQLFFGLLILPILYLTHQGPSRKAVRMF